MIDQYLHTDIPVGTIARNHAMNERDVTRIRHDAGIPPRRTRVRGLPAAMAGLAEARARLRAQSAAPPKLDSAPAQTSVPATEPPDNHGPGTALPAVDRIQRLVEQELAAEEAGRAEFGLLPRAPGDAERSARTLAILTKTLQALARLRGGATEQGSADDDDDMPADMDEFRNELARRIRVFVQSRTGEDVCGAVESADGAAIEP